MNKGTFWICAVPTLLFMNMVIVGITVFFSIRGKGYVPQDYYSKALRWQDEQAQSATNARLRWSLEPSLVRESSGAFRAHFLLTTEDGTPLDGATVQGRCFHNAHPASAQALTVSPLGDGAYAAPLIIDRDGWWTFELTVRRGPETFTLLTERLLMRDNPAAPPPVMIETETAG
jgi:nitrogen fixation protein FixH